MKRGVEDVLHNLGEIETLPSTPQGPEDAHAVECPGVTNMTTLKGFIVSREEAGIRGSTSAMLLSLILIASSMAESSKLPQNMITKTNCNTFSLENLPPPLTSDVPGTWAYDTMSR